MSGATYKVIAMLLTMQHQPSGELTCATIQEPTLSILAICEPSAMWFNSGACIMCAYQRNNPYRIIYTPPPMPGRVRKLYRDRVR